MILGQQLVPAEAEQAVKAYHCTSFRSRLLGIRAEGYLEVTNKRVVFQATGGDSLIHSEVPIDDVSGISLFRGNYFSIKHFLGALVLAWFLSSIVAVAVAAVTAVVSKTGQLAILNWIVALAALGGSFAVPRSKVWRTVLAGIAGAGFGSIGGLGVLDSIQGAVLGGYGSFGATGGGGWGTTLALLLALAMAVYVVVCAAWYSVRSTMSLAISSKGGSNTPIAIAGASVGGALFSSAARALEAEPAGDAETVMKELGALIMDIQQRGDLIIDKWRPGAGA